MSQLTESGLPILRGRLKYEVMIDIAKGQWTLAELAELYGVKLLSIRALASRNADAIAEIRENLRAELRKECAGLWIADKAKRMASRQQMIEDIERHIATRQSDDKYIPAKLLQVYEQILHDVAEELGDIPERPKASASSGERTEYIIRGVATEDLQGALT